MRIVLAPDKFKGSLSARQVADALAAGIHRASASTQVDVLPVADGGDGTVAALGEVGHEIREATCVDALGVPHIAPYAVRGSRAVVAISDTSGLARLPAGRRDGSRATSFGLGEVVSEAVARGATEVVIGLGGSASTDGGAGFLAGLGARVCDASGRPLGPGAAGLRDAASCDLGPAFERLRGVRLTVASDVTNPLCGPTGAAAVYGPQKGLDPAGVAEADEALARWADLLAAVVGVDHRDAPGAGAAGGVGFACLALGATVVSGIDWLLDAQGARGIIAGADLVVTGEGALDDQTLQGKAPMGVARLAGELGVPVVAVCGRSLISPEDAALAGFTAVHSLLDVEPDLARCLADPEPLLARIGERLVADLG